jgi:hypothetical protein
METRMQAPEFGINALLNFFPSIEPDGPGRNEAAQMENLTTLRWLTD